MEQEITGRSFDGSVITIDTMAVDFEGDSLTGYYRLHKPSKVKKGRRKLYSHRRVLFLKRVIAVDYKAPTYSHITKMVKHYF